MTDADGGTLKAVFEVKDTATGVTTTCTSAMVASGGTATCTPAADLAEKGYQVRGKADDGTDDSRKVDDQPDTASSDWAAFTVASATPGGPSISCPTPYTNSSWASSAPSAEVTCTATAAGSGTSSAGRILVQVDQGTLKTVVIDQSSDPAVAKTTVSVPKSMGGHEITATAQSPSGTLSAPATYAFGYGTVGMSLPVVDPLTVTSGGLKIDANGPPGSGTPTGSLLAPGRVRGRRSDRVDH